MSPRWALYAQGVAVLAAVVVVMLLARWATMGW